MQTGDLGNGNAQDFGDPSIDNSVPEIPNESELNNTHNNKKDSTLKPVGKLSDKPAEKTEDKKDNKPVNTPAAKPDDKNKKTGKNDKPKTEKSNDY
jgi:hypothetical protein